MSTVQGIDVSKWNGAIDWARVKAAGYTFAMIRLGYCGSGGTVVLDSAFLTNMQGALAAGMNTGVYVYSYATTADAAKVAAEQTLNYVREYKLTYPVAFDMEDQTYVSMSKKDNTSIVDAYLSTIQEAGYYGILYTFKSFADSFLNMGSLSAHDVWIAQWASAVTYSGSYGMWQYSSTGSVDGISGNVDLNHAYKDYPSIIKAAGLNGFEPTDENTPVSASATTEAAAKTIEIGADSTIN